MQAGTQAGRGERTQAVRAEHVHEDRLDILRGGGVVVVVVVDGGGVGGFGGGGGVLITIAGGDAFLVDVAVTFSVSGNVLIAISDTGNARSTIIAITIITWLRTHATVCPMF